MVRGSSQKGHPQEQKNQDPDLMRRRGQSSDHKEAEGQDSGEYIEENCQVL